MPGGCAITIALAAIQQGVRVRLWHPLPQDADSEYSLAHLRQAGVDLTGCPRFSGPPGRCVIIYADHQRAAWTSLPQGDDFDFDHAVLSGVDHVIVTAKWGRWTERLLMLAQQSNIPCSLVGEAPPAGKRFPWYAVVVDEPNPVKLTKMTAGFGWLLVVGMELPSAGLSRRSMYPLSKLTSSKQLVRATFSAGRLLLESC